MIQPGFVIHDTDKGFRLVIEGNVFGTARDGNRISAFANEYAPFDFRPHLSLLYMKNLVLADVDVLEGDIPTRVDDPLHCEGFFVEGNAAEGFAGDRVGK